jgi:phage protein D
MTPDYKILADNNDITAAIRDRLISLTLTDEAGIQSDSISLVLDDRDNAIQLPRKGAQLDVFMGYKETGLVKKGLFTVDEIEISGPPDIITIKGKAANMRASLKAPKTRSFDNLKLGDIVRTLANDNQLTPKISPDLADLVIPHLDQTNESDLHFLTRIARQYGAISKPVEGHLLFVVKGETKSATGKVLSEISINKTQTSDYTATLADRDKYKAVIAHWQDTKTAQKIAVKTSNDAPAFTLRHTYQDQETAAQAAKSKIASLNRGTGTVSLTLSNGDALLFAESVLHLSGFRTGVNGAWTSTHVEHEINAAGYKTRIDADVKS